MNTYFAGQLAYRLSSYNLRNFYAVRRFFYLIVVNLMKKVIFTFALALALSGCSSVSPSDLANPDEFLLKQLTGGPKTFKGPNGEDMLSVTCSEDLGDCYGEIAEACGSAGYEIVQQDGQSGTTTESMGTLNNGAGGLHGMSQTNSELEVKRNVLAKCKK